MIARLLVLPKMTTGKHNGSRRRALGHRRVSVLKQQPLARDAVKRGRLNPPCAISTRVQSPIIGDGEEDVGTFVRGENGMTTYQHAERNEGKAQ
jgi:hypothetical protein